MPFAVHKSAKFISQNVAKWINYVCAVILLGFAGFLPEKPEAKHDDQPEKSYSFPESGNLDIKSLEEFRENFRKTLEEVKKIKDPFSSDNLSDEFVGLKPSSK